MGQTLTHGVYLPDEGERNCYSGLAANWQILDTSVGTIAAHTAALAGKAPAVHTHTKSDVTDLLNSNFIPSANNSYDLGSSSYQWNNLYAKNYYYNGTAWGLDKTNTWTGNNTFTGRTSYIGIYDKFQTTAFDVRTDPESTRGGDIFRFWGGTGATYGDYLGGMSFYQNTDGSLALQLICFGYPVTGNAKQNRINFHSSRDGTTAFYPVQNNSISLGTSTNKWKTLNGVNPGALSLPNLDSDGYIDLSSNISANSEYLYTPTSDGWLALYCQTTGFHAENAVGIFNRVDATSYTWSNSVTSSINLLRYGTYHGSIILPVRAGIRYGCWVVVNSSTPLSSSTLFFYKAKGNV